MDLWVGTEARHNAIRVATVITCSIRPSRVDEGEALRDIERRAGQRFHEVGLHDVAAAEPTSVDELARYAEAGRSWTVVTTDDEPLGYVIVRIVDGQTHIEQISVLPQYQGKGLGRALQEHVCAWTRRNGMQAITLTTFAAVPWNQPLYEHLASSYSATIRSARNYAVCRRTKSSSVSIQHREYACDWISIPDANSYLCRVVRKSVTPSSSSMGTA